MTNIHVYPTTAYNTEKQTGLSSAEAVTASQNTTQAKRYTPGVLTGRQAS